MTGLPVLIERVMAGVRTASILLRVMQHISFYCILTIMFGFSCLAHGENEKEKNSPLPQPFLHTEYFFEKVGVAGSIPLDIITALTQDSRGIIWIGTQFGLIKFDGYHFEKFVHNTRDPHSISGDYIKSLWGAPDGRIWAGTLSGGISIFDPQLGKFFPLVNSNDQSNPFKTGTIQSIIGDHQGGVWIVSTELGLSYFAPGAKSITHFRHDVNDPNSLMDDMVRSIAIDRQGDLWVGTMSGLQHVKKGTTKFLRVATNEGDSGSLFGEEIRTIFEAKDGKIWLGLAHNGAAWLDPQTHALHFLPLSTSKTNQLNDNIVDFITEVGEHEIWLSRYGYGIVALDARDGHVLQEIRNDPTNSGSLAFDQIGALLLDRSGLLWVGTWGGGLQRYNPQQDAIRLLKHSPTKPSGLSRPNVRSILERNDGRFLIGTDGNGIDIIDRSLGLIGGYRPQAERPDTSIATAVLALTQMPDNTIWAGTRQSGVKKLRPNSTVWKTYSTQHGLPSNQIRSIFSNKRGDLWVGTTQGVARWQEKEDRFETFSSVDGVAMSSYVTSFTESKTKQLWVGSESGLWIYEPKSQQFKQIKQDKNVPDSLISNEVNGLLIDHEEHLWVDTAQGLERLISWDGKNAKFEHISEQLGRPGLYFGANLLEDKLGRIWTQWFIYDPKTKRLDDLSKASGVDIGTAWINAFARTKDGLFLFGGTQGIAVINPNLFQVWSYQPPIVATGLKIDGLDQSLIHLNGGLQISPKNRNFDIEFAALDYLGAEKNRYAYRLLDHQNDWIETDSAHRNARFGNLWPGKYTLQLKGSNRHGDWSPHELSIPITILPAFWQTTWFIGIIILTIGSGLWQVYRWQTTRVRNEKRLLQNLIDARTADIMKLGEVGQGLTATLDTEKAFERIHKQVSARVDAHVFCINFFDENKGTIEVDYAIEDNIRQLPFKYTLDEINRPAVWCVLNRRELITNKMSDLLNYLDAIAPVKIGECMESIIYLPLFVEEKVIGCMTVQSQRQFAYEQDQIGFLRALANYVAIAVANSQSHRHLIDAQRQLAQQEKMASLGQLVANVAHEINTPIGAIKSSSTNISNALNTAMTELSRLMYLLSDETRELFLELIANVNTTNIVLNTREERKIISATSAELDQRGIANARHIANILVQLRAQHQIEHYFPLLLHPECDRILNVANEIAAIVNSTKNIHLAVDRVSKIVFAFKAFSRMGTHNEKIAADIRDGMETVLTLYQSKFSKGTELICLFDDIPEILCWPDELVQVWVNLIHNALQAMDYQGVLTITIQRIANDAVVSIQDTGKGIPDEIRDRIFDVFFTTKPVGEGSGLGLDIVKKIVLKHRGTITFDSKVNVGTTFTVTLPYT